MITLTNNVQEINEIITDKEVRPWLSDDELTPFLTEIPKTHIYLKSSIDNQLAGVFWFIKKNSICCEGHYAFKKEFWGKTKPEALEALEYIFTKTNYEKIEGQTPIDNRRAIAWLKSLGFEIEGNSKQSIKINNILIDQIYYGMRKERWDLTQSQRL